MRFRSNHAGLAEGLSLVFIIIISRVFLSALTVILEKSAQLSWATIILSGIFTLVAFYMLLFVAVRVPGDLFTMCQHVLGKVAAWLICLFYFFLFWGDAIILLRQFAENTILVALTDMKIEPLIAWYAIIIATLIYMGFDTIIRTGYVLLPYLVAGMLTISVLLFPNYNIYRLTPWQGNGLAPAFSTSIFSGGFNIGILTLVIMKPAFQNIRTIRAACIYGLGLSVFVKVVYTVTYIMVFGTIVGAEKSAPFFEMARLIYFGTYIQHIESLFIILWVSIGMLAIATNLHITLYLFTRLLDLSDVWPIVPLVITITANIALLPESLADVIQADTLFITILCIGLYVPPTLLFLATLSY